ncbi:TPM domain-containing protein [Cellulophaga sp. 20_2_10]|uniref:TPM domain-containing protein n=1 Tax=Cellulophaga sp. 20_2_10 TaxID=2942476 RepID=UPI00201A2C6D|nr:TPM domain-containing protein [Cellulophaga sp. 20_2_10]MCL5247457.1 TPM domain-containing protein [Cellulophaga sp. 20_2_10]
MKTAVKIIVLLVTFVLISCKGNAQETKKSIFPESVGIINDYSKIFTELQRKQLAKTLYDYDVKTTRQIVVITVDSISPYTNIQKYATDLGNHWGVGTAEKNNGLTIVVCTPCREMAIATGTGTELVLTNEICTTVLEKTILPEFKKGDFYSGIEKGITELIIKWE